VAADVSAEAFARFTVAGFFAAGRLLGFARA
jgi:hypothetical protein